MKKILSLLFVAMLVVAVGCENDDDDYTCEEAAVNITNIACANDYKINDLDCSIENNKEKLYKYSVQNCKGYPWPQDLINCLATASNLEQLDSCD